MKTNYLIKHFRHIFIFYNHIYQCRPDKLLARTDLCDNWSYNGYIKLHCFTDRF